MTWRRLALGSILGMLLTAVIVYSLTPSPVRDAQVQNEASVEPDGSLVDEEEFARLVEEVERLRALLDGGSPNASDLMDASDVPDASVDAGRAGPAAPRRHICSTGMTAAQLAHMMERIPALRQLPPGKLRLMQARSAECACTPGPGGDSTCASWCAPTGTYRGRCVPGANKCECSY